LVIGNATGNTYGILRKGGGAMAPLKGVLADLGSALEHLAQLSPAFRS